MTSARCLTCDAEILVAPTPRGGRALLNPQPGKPSSGGAYAIRDGLALRVFADVKLARANDRRIHESDCAGLPRYVEHDATCAAAARVLEDAATHGALSAQLKQRTK